MSRSLIPMFLSNWPELSEELEEMAPFTSRSSGVTISEDDDHVFVETALPGIDPAEVEVTFDQGVLFVKGAKEETEEDRSRKYYRKATSAFSYRLHVPGEIDEEKEPEATFERGVMKISFKKRRKIEPKKIKIKELK